MKLSGASLLFVLHTSLLLAMMSREQCLHSTIRLRAYDDNLADHNNASRHKEHINWHKKEPNTSANSMQCTCNALKKRRCQILACITFSLTGNFLCRSPRLSMQPMSSFQPLTIRFLTGLKKVRENSKASWKKTFLLMLARSRLTRLPCLP